MPSSRISACAFGEVMLLRGLGDNGFAMLGSMMHVKEPSRNFTDLV